MLSETDIYGDHGRLLKTINEEADNITAQLDKTIEELDARGKSKR